MAMRAPGNPMDVYAQMPGGVPLSLGTTQPAGRFVRRPQAAKFFTYVHEFIPNSTVGWVAGATGIRDQFQVDGDADFHVMKTALMSTDVNGVRLGDTLKFEVSPVSESYNFAEMFLSEYGSGRFPGAWQTPIVLPRSAVYTAIAANRNLGGLITTIRIAHFGAKVYRNPYIGGRVYRGQKPYAYVANFTAFDGGVGVIAAGATSIATLRTDGDSDFDVRKITIVSDAPITLQVRTDDDQWFHRALRSELMGGTLAETFVNGTVSGELPFFLPVPRLISGAGYINVLATNSDAVNSIRAQVTFWGTRLYPAGGGAA